MAAYISKLNPLVMSRYAIVVLTIFKKEPGLDIF